MIFLNLFLFSEINFEKLLPVRNFISVFHVYCVAWSHNCNIPSKILHSYRNIGCGRKTVARHDFWLQCTMIIFHSQASMFQEVKANNYHVC